MRTLIRLFPLLILLPLLAEGASFRSASSNVTEANPLTINTPTSCASGDVMVAALASDANGTTITHDGAWTTGPANNAADISLVTFHRTLSGAPAANYTFTSNAEFIIGSIICIDAAGGTSPVVATNGVSAEDGTTSNTPSITNVANTRVWVGFYLNDSAFTVTTPPTGPTAAHALLAAGAYSLAAYYQNDPADGAGIVRTLVWSGSDALLSTAYLVSFTASGGSPSIPMIFRHQRQMKQ
jgi:hypothetical protein